MIVLGLDLALGKTGWAHVLYEDGSLLASGIIEPTTFVLDARLAHIAAEVKKVCGDSISNVFVEAPYVGHRNNTIKLGMVHGAVLAQLHGGPPVNSVPPSSLKLWATGSGKATKEQMIAAAEQRFGRWLTSDEADAALVAAWGREQIERAMAHHPTGA